MGNREEYELLYVYRSMNARSPREQRRALEGMLCLDDDYWDGLRCRVDDAVRDGQLLSAQMDDFRRAAFLRDLNIDTYYKDAVESILNLHLQILGEILIALDQGAF